MPLLCLLFVSFFLSVTGSFCRQSDDNGENHNNFPLPKPYNDLVPWVWDAIFDENLRRVEITVVSRRICFFNESRWLRVVELFPHYSVAHFASGNPNNILVSFTSMLDFHLNMTHHHSKKTWKKKVHQKNSFDRVIGERFSCVYYAARRLSALATTEALVIQGSSAFMSSSAFQVICPVPKTIVSFDEMMLQRHFVWDDSKKMLLPRPLLKARQMTGEQGLLTATLDTARFPVCRLSQLYEELSRKNTDLIRPNVPLNEGSTNVAAGSGNQLSYLYNLSICTVTNRVSFDAAMEWIEYHRLIGIEHFFVYNTARHHITRELKRTYASYTNEGLVTLVDWPYENCAINMSSGRYLYYREKNPLFQDTLHNNEGLWTVQQGMFKPPYCLAQHAALASCYARYRKTSKYMLLIDDDEFVMTRSKDMTMGSNKHHTSLPVNPSVPWIHEKDAQTTRESLSLSLFADKYFAKHQKIGGLKFAPIVKGLCQQTLSHQVGSLPRIGTWTQGRVGEQNEGKLLLRTAMILSVTVHFFLQPEPGQKVQRQFFLMPYSEGALLHYKQPPSADGDIFGSYLDDRTKESFCSQFQQLGGFVEDLTNPVKGKLFQMYNAQNISTAPKLIRWFYKEWRATADESSPYLHSIHPVLKTALMRRITAMKKKP